MLDDLKRILGLSSTEKFLSKEAEYSLYALVHESIEKGDKDTGIWAAAFSKAEGDEQKAKALYIELMVERLKNAIKANEEIKGMPSFKEEKPKYSASTPYKYGKATNYKPKSKNKSSPGHFVYGKEASNKKKSTYSYGKGRRTKK
mgnify:CR=1 FL=1